jgi:hypothetical protein
MQEVYYEKSRLDQSKKYSRWLPRTGATWPNKRDDTDPNQTLKKYSQ